jgi:hypothetical protein
MFSSCGAQYSLLVVAVKEKGFPATEALRHREKSVMKCKAGNRERRKRCGAVAKPKDQKTIDTWEPVGRICKNQNSSWREK